jgi:SAM-dependent methyltransferase
VALDRSQRPSNLQVLKQLSEGLLRSAGRTNVRGNLLEIHHPSAPEFDPVFLHTSSELIDVSVSLAQHQQAMAGQKVCCDSGELPFQDRSFRMVVLHHVVGDGSEPELAEACRVTSHNGVLILLGLNRLGWRYRAQDAIRRLPGIAPLKVKTRLEQLGMTMQGFAGAGLCGWARPVFMNSGLSGLGAPVADVVILQASHADSPGVTPLRFRKPKASVVQSAPIGG